MKLKTDPLNVSLIVLFRLNSYRMMTPFGLAGSRHDTWMVMGSVALNWGAFMN